jgi:hypothetical protein
MLSFLKYWRKTGLPVGGKTHQILGFASVNRANPSEISQTIDLFGGVYLGVALPVTAQNQTMWSVPNGLTGDAAPGSWGGHCVPIVADSLDSTYAIPQVKALAPCPGVWEGPGGLKVITWGAVYPATWYFLLCYADEAYVVFAPEWLNQTTGLSPSKFDYAQLLADLAAL